MHLEIEFHYHNVHCVSGYWKSGRDSSYLDLTIELNQARAGFLEIDFVRDVCVYVCVRPPGHLRE